MKKLLAAFAALVVLAIVFGCADDIILPEEEPIVGQYYGTYTIIENYGTPSENVYQNYVFWEFTETEYIMKVDTDSIQTDGACFCYNSGQYSLTDGIRLRTRSWNATGSPPQECTSCNDDFIPNGTFQRQLQGGVLILRSHDNAQNIFHELRLSRVAEEE